MARITAGAGTAIGWGSAAGLIFLDTDSQRIVLAQAFALSVGIVSVVWLLISCRNRPMGAVFQLGSELGRKEERKAFNRSDRVVVPMSRQDRQQAMNG